MVRFLLLIALLSFPCGLSRIGAGIPMSGADGECDRLYGEMGLAGQVSYEAFRRAYFGYGEIGGRTKEVVTLIDFTKPSTEPRLFVLDMKDHKILFSTYVSHGRNSGENYARTFSNRDGSYMSSLGFYLTLGTYQGSNGYSLALDGLEKGINDRARQRAIVIHGAAYADPSVIASTGRLGRSLGCPALPRELNRPIIDTIKNGSLIYIHADDRDYLRQSAFGRRS